MIKKCKYCGKSYKILIEKDARLYKELMNTSSIKSRLKFKNLILPVTMRCNMNCPICYENVGGIEMKNRDLDMSIIDQLNFEGKDIGISGGEPTVRNDLPVIIKKLSMKYIPTLVTNGKLLSNINYLNRLRKSGLKYIVLSFNSVDNDKIYEIINREKLLKIKLRALKNIKKLNMKVMLSVMVVKGINESQLEKIVRFAAKNSDFIREVRIRAEAPFGRFIKGREKMRMSEIIEKLSSIVTIEEILAELRLRKILAELIRRPYVHKPCSLIFHLKIDGDKIIPLGRFFIDLFKKNSKLINLAVIFRFLRIVGVKTIFRWLLSSFNVRKTYINSRQFLAIGLRVWYDKSDIDLEEIKRCHTAYFHDGKIESFCYFNTMRN
jgi:uncharacterized radical SAM superfamily Fe-S cluster-containing enzyme